MQSVRRCVPIRSLTGGPQLGGPVAHSLIAETLTSNTLLGGKSEQPVD